MESCQVTVTQNNKIEFHGVRNTYQTGEQVSCYFTVPSAYKPEVGDWIGIYPVGWSTVGHVMCKKLVKPENVWSTQTGQQYGKIEFECELLPKGTEQYYQFVYVKNGEYIRGASTPFMFAQQLEQELGQQKQQWQQQQIQQLIQQEQQEYQQQKQQQQQLERPLCSGNLLELVVEKEMQKLQNNLYGLEQGLAGYKTVYPLIEETIYQQPQQYLQQQQQQTELLGQIIVDQYVQPTQVRKHWQNRVAEVQQMITEQAKLEQAQRRVEQLAMLAQLKSCERHIQYVQRQEQAIKEHSRARLAVKVAEFEQKVYQVLKLQQQQQQVLAEQPEQYVRKYEQLLKEKVELDIQKRVAILHKLRQTVKECERKLRELQQGEQQHHGRFQVTLKQRIGQFETKFVQPAIYTVLGQTGQQGTILYEEKIECDLREQLKHQVGQLYQEQRREQYQLIKAHKQLAWLCNEISARLQELECPEIYRQLRVPRVQTVVGLLGGVFGPQYQQQQQYNEQQQQYLQLIQLEQQLSELKSNLRMKLTRQQQQQLPRQLVEQLTQGVWLKPVLQKLRELELVVRQEKLQNQYELPRHSTWYERRLQNLNQHIKYIEQQTQQQQQQYEEVKLREILTQLRELESELYEYPQYFQQYKQQKQQQQIVQLCELLQCIVGEKVNQLASVYEQCSPIECYIQSGNHTNWRQVVQFERKLVQLKCMLVEKQQYHQLQQRLGELEQQVALICLTNGRQQQQQLRSVEQQIRLVRQMLETHHQYVQQQYQQQQNQQQQYQQQYQQQQHYLFAAPEQFLQHQQKYERLLQLVCEVEQQVVEQQVQQQLQQQLQQQQPRLPSLLQQTVQQQTTVLGLGLIQQKFEQLVKEFQQRMTLNQVQLPEQVAQKVEAVYQFLKNETQSNKQYYGQQLKEKIVEFETLVCLEQQLQQQQRQELQQLLGQQQQQQTCWLLQTPLTIQQYVRQVAKQVRELKSQVQCVLDDWVLVNCQQNGELQQWENDWNNNQCGQQGIYEPVELYETALGELTSLRQQQQQKQEVQQLFDLEYFLPKPYRYQQQQQQQQYQQQQQQLQQLEATLECQRLERQLEQIQQQHQQQYQQQYQQQQQLEDLLCGETTQFAGLRTPITVETLIAELENDLVKLRVQQRETYLPTVPSQTSLWTLGQQQQQQIETAVVCDELSKLVGQNLLTTVVPSIVKVVQQQQEKGQQQQTTTTTVFNVEPTPFGTTTQTVKVQQREITQQPKF